MKSMNSMYVTLYINGEIDYSYLIENINIKELTEDEMDTFFSLAKDTNRSIVLYELFLKKYKEDIVLEKFLKNIFDPTKIYEVALRVKSQKSVNLLAEAVIKTKDEYYIHVFARDIEEAPIEKLAEAVIKTEDHYYIYVFARDVEKAPIEKLADTIIETKDAACIYLFARDVKGAPIDKLTDAIIETKDVKRIYSFARDVKEAPIELLMDILLDIQPEIVAKYLLDEYISSEALVKKIIRTLQIKGIDVTKIEENYNLDDDDLLNKIKNCGLIKVFEDIEVRSKFYYLNYLTKELPETEIILQVYLKFLTTDMKVEEARALDLEYKRLMLEEVKREAKTSKETETVQVRKPVE